MDIDAYTYLYTHIQCNIKCLVKSVKSTRHWNTNSLNWHSVWIQCKTNWKSTNGNENKGQIYSETNWKSTNGNEYKGPIYSETLLYKCQIRHVLLYFLQIEIRRDIFFM